MYTEQEKCTMNWADSYTLLYGFIAKRMIENCGLEGEAAVREATRQFGYDRAETTRKKHLSVGAKINMLNLFTLYHDLPGDPRFRRELQEINPQERVSHTLVCPMADIWKEYGQMAIGRIYCEEFHPACYNHYAFDQTRVNLSKTLTQEGDEYCDFNVILRPEQMDPELRKLCFAEYDPEYVEPEFPCEKEDGKRGFAVLSIKLYYYLLKYAVKDLGEDGKNAVRQGLKEFADAICDLFVKRAEKDGRKVDETYLQDNFPLALEAKTEQKLWKNYMEYSSMEEYERWFVNPLKEGLGL